MPQNSWQMYGYSPGSSNSAVSLDTWPGTICMLMFVSCSLKPCCTSTLVMWKVTVDPAGTVFSWGEQVLLGEHVDLVLATTEIPQAGLAERPGVGNGAGIDLALRARDLKPERETGNGHRGGEGNE